MSSESSVQRPASAVTLHIERLVFEGVPLAPRDAAAFRSAFEAEITRLLATVPADAWSGGALARLVTETVRLSAGGSVRAWAREAAGALVAGLPRYVSQTPRHSRGGAVANGIAGRFRR